MLWCFMDETGGVDIDGKNNTKMNNHNFSQIRLFFMSMMHFYDCTYLQPLAHREPAKLVFCSNIVFVRLLINVLVNLFWNRFTWISMLVVFFLVYIDKAVIFCMYNNNYY
jgi:hypothetical protein